jgi:asparagine N-glycosylation enzyme membrane subunit Stt3
MVRMRIGVMVVVMAVLIAMAVVVCVTVLIAVAVVMAMTVVPVAVVMPPEGNGNAIGLACTGAFALAEIAAIREPLHMVVMALLRQSHLVFKTEHLGAVLAERAVHRRFSADHFLHPLHKGVEHQGVIPQVLS